MAETRIIDVRNMPCPEPVIKTKKALEGVIEGGTLNVLVNTIEARQNVERFAQSQGCNVNVSEKNGVFSIEICKRQKVEDKTNKGADVLLIASDCLGNGDETLGQLLIAAFINTLPESRAKPSKILFINRGVMLTTEGSRVIDTLQNLENNGVQIYSCGTCLNHYQLKEKLKVGKITNMYDTVESLLTAARVVRI